ncbi:MAG: hypothetical protein SFX73_32260 [Kofleriaceae bacterium]|nr:hypothetical protein [Kofleriaceae bacterium]
MQHLATNLVAARLELHYAAQIVAACADAWLPERADDGHTSMTWRSPTMVGERTPTEAAIGVRAIDFAVLAFHGEEIQAFPLAGKTLAEGLAWADAQLGPPRGAKLRSYDLPASPLRSGARFTGPEAALAELARWYDAGLAVVGRYAEPRTIRIWPHHFDLGAILPGNIGIGLSPGDAHYAEPYYYVTPPAPLARAPQLAGGGFWRTEGWTGAVLLASADGDPDAFVRSALAAMP